MVNEGRQRSYFWRELVASKGEEVRIAVDSVFLVSERERSPRLRIVGNRVGMGSRGGRVAVNVQGKDVDALLSLTGLYLRDNVFLFVCSGATGEGVSEWKLQASGPQFSNRKK